MNDHQTYEVREIVTKVAALCRETLDGSTTAEGFVDQLGKYFSQATDVMQGLNEHHFVEGRPSHEWETYATSTKVVEWCNSSGVTLDKRTYWWYMSQARSGNLAGVPNSAGIARVTDGVMVWIERRGQSPLLGHLASWRKDPLPSTRKASVGSKIKDILAAGGDRAKMHRQLLEALLGDSGQ